MTYYRKGLILVIDAEQAQKIAEKHYEEVYTYCLSQVNSNTYDAEEITQDVFLLFQQKCDNLEDTFISRWLMVTAKNKVREYYRKNKKTNMLLPFDETILQIEDTEIERMFAENLPADDEEIQKYINIIKSFLSKKELMLFDEVFVQKKKYKDIARDLNISESAVSSRVSRLKRKIRQMVKLMFTSFGQFIIKVFF